MKKQKKRSGAQPRPVRASWYVSLDVMRETDQAMQEYMRDRIERFADSFADNVVRRGFGAKIQSGPHEGKTWQARGREMFGKERFKIAMQGAIERARRSSA